MERQYLFVKVITRSGDRAVMKITYSPTRAMRYAQELADRYGWEVVIE